MLTADSIGKCFRGERILASARLTAARGELVGLLGRIGSGKSTLLRICAGVIRPDSGWVELDGHKYFSGSRSAFAGRGVFYLGEGENLAWTLTVRQHLDEMARRFGSFDRDEIIGTLELGPVMDQKPPTLSGGEVKRVELALAFARRPLCLLADEPFRSADPRLRELLGSSFRLLAASGCAVVVTGHEVTSLMPFLDSVTWVTSGTTHLLGSTESALSNDAFRREYLGASYGQREVS